MSSLENAGFVHKPDLLSFRLDYGTLLFAGKAKNSFPMVQSCVKICNSITKKTGLNAAVAVFSESITMKMESVKSVLYNAISKIFEN